MKLQDREFFRRDVLCVAPELVGRILVRRLPDGTLLRARITETEAYRGEQDTACHASRGRTRRTEVLYHDGGTIYVYLCYGMHWMLNIVTGHDVEHPVHPVAEVDVDRAAVMVEHLRAPCAAAAGVAGGVLLAAVGLRLRDARAQQRAVRQPAHQNAPNQLRRDAKHVAPEKFPILQFHGSQLA